MYTFLIILAIVLCVLLGFFILIQNPKGGGLSSGFSGSNNIMGVQRTGDFLEKGSWVLAITIMVLSLLINLSIPKGGATDAQGPNIENKVNKAAPAPILPAPKPADTTKK